MISHKRPSKLTRYHFGAPYYPEHWSEADRQNDISLMRNAHFNMVRMAEFAWNIIEAEEGKYDFRLFDEVIAELGKAGISTMMCTPTATPPRWLSLKHPEMMRIDEDGVVMEHGSRQHFCHSSKKFREYSRGITRTMAEHYRDNPHVVAWQTDNEINCHFSECHCDSCQQVFREFLQKKYGDIDRLNEAWGTSFWALTYSSFAEITTVKPMKPTYVNPAARLDYFRFIANNVATFQQEQIEILKEVKDKWFTVHNGLMRLVDYRGQFGQDLDVLGFDIYPMFQHDPIERRAAHAFNCDRARGYTGNFFTPEHQSGPGGQPPYFLSTPEPGEMRMLTYRSIARGMDGLLYFRWRTCRFGAEEYWCGIIDHDNIPRRRYNEVRKVGEELSRLGDEIMGSHVDIDCAVASCDFDAQYSHEACTLGLNKPDHFAELIHGVLYRDGYNIGCVHPADDLGDLKLYIIPHWAVFRPEWVPALQKWVEEGGTLVIGARTATRDVNNNVVCETIPGCLSELAGVKVEDYGRQNDNARRELYIKYGKKRFLSDLWYEELVPGEGTKVLAEWDSRFLKGRAAVTYRDVGKGKVIYMGTYFNNTAAQAILPGLAAEAGCQPVIKDLPEGVEAVRRVKGETKLTIIINSNEKKVVVNNIKAGKEMLSDVEVNGKMELEGYDIAVVKRDHG